jgi:dTMP kinase
VDRFESEREQFFERVRQAYLDLAAKEPQRIVVIDASATLDVVQSQVTAALERLTSRATR